MTGPVILAGDDDPQVVRADPEPSAPGTLKRIESVVKSPRSFSLVNGDT